MILYIKIKLKYDTTRPQSVRTGLYALLDAVLKVGEIK